ncbi:MAG: immunoglobulin domain-containing protein, partial [Fibrobacter sp.]|nr:immunoglobulin domain-containing protein [Fibrobacter sp.]
MKSKINSLIFLFCSFLICLTVLCSNWERNNPLDPKSNSYVEPVKKPTIINHPKDQIVFEGEKATFSVTATGADLKYQWKRNESIISGATNSSYTISAVNIDDDGLYYYCVVSNSAGSVASNNASLHVKSVESPIVKPIITNHPKNQFVNEGEKATFSVTASGKNLSYQWKKNGSNISGATNSSYTTSVVDSYDDYDYYSCVISNSAGSTTSNTAYLYVKSVNNDNLLSKPAVLDDFNDEYGDTPNQTTVGAVYGASKFGIAYKGGGYWYSYCDDGGSMVTTIKGVIVSSSDDASAFLVKDAGDGMFAFKLITSKSKDEYPYSVVACNLAGDDTKK